MPDGFSDLMSTSDCPQLTGVQRPSCYGCGSAINNCGMIPVIPVADASNIDEASYTSDGSDWAILMLEKGHANPLEDQVLGARTNRRLRMFQTRRYVKPHPAVRPGAAPSLGNGG